MKYLQRKTIKVNITIVNNLLVTIIIDRQENSHYNWKMKIFYTLSFESRLMRIAR